MNGIETAPLERFSVVDTRSPEEARERIGKIFCPHFLLPLERRPVSFHARHNFAPQAGYSANFVGYGAEVEIDPGELSRFFLLQWPIRGGAQVRCGAGTAEARAGSVATVLSPSLPTRMVWREDCEKLIVLITREALQRQFEALSGAPGPAIEFEVGIDAASAVGHKLRAHVDLIVSAAETGSPIAYQILLRDALTTLMLTSLRHSRSAALETPVRPAAPGAVRRAEAYLDAHAAAPIAMEDVATAAGANLRSLQAAFKAARGSTLTEALQQRRLELFRQRLTDPSSPGSVTDIAYSVGLAHLGRAAAAYRARFGETPRETLRRR